MAAGSCSSRFVYFASVSNNRRSASRRRASRAPMSRTASVAVSSTWGISALRRRTEARKRTRAQRRRPARWAGRRAFMQGASELAERHRVDQVRVAQLPQCLTLDQTHPLTGETQHLAGLAQAEWLAVLEPVAKRH